eukprot:760080-Prymnesium_polylepis.1
MAACAHQSRELTTGWVIRAAGRFTTWTACRVHLIGVAVQGRGTAVNARASPGVASAAPPCDR